MLTLSPGERAGEKASMNSNSTENVGEPKFHSVFVSFVIFCKNCLPVISGLTGGETTR